MPNDKPVTLDEVDKLAGLFERLEGCSLQAKKALTVRALLATADDKALFDTVCDSLTVSQLHTALQEISYQHEYGNPVDPTIESYKSTFKAALEYAHENASQAVKLIFSRHGTRTEKLTLEMQNLALEISKDVGHNVLAEYDQLTGEPVVTSRAVLGDTPPDVVDDIDYQANKPVGGHQPPASQVVGQGPSSPHPDQDPPGPGSGYSGDPVSINQVW